MWLTMRSGLNREEQRKDKKQKGNERGQSRLSHWDEEEEKEKKIGQDRFRPQAARGIARMGMPSQPVASSARKHCGWENSTL